MNRCLMIAFHYPPAKGSSGIQRTLSFSRFLPQHNWEPLVLTASESAYPATGNDQLDDIPPNMVVERALCLDSARHLAIRGKYAEFTAYPDRWITWFPAAVAKGVAIVRRYRPALIWSTYPIATAHLIAYAIHRISGIPWIADFRDSMTEDEYPVNVRRRKCYRWIESRAIMHAKRSVFTAPGTVQMYDERYRNVRHEEFLCILNGYDETAFERAEAGLSGQHKKSGRKVIVHSGLLYLSERDPTAFFEALRTLKRRIPDLAAKVEIRLRASGFEVELRKLIASDGLEDLVTLYPSIPYIDALAEMMAADGLLLFQASNCNHQIPAKLYEYLRAQKPILALTDPDGDTAQILETVKTATVAALDSTQDIERSFESFLESLNGLENRASDNDKFVQQYSREFQTRQLAQVFDSVT